MNLKTHTAKSFPGEVVPGASSALLPQTTPGFTSRVRTLSVALFSVMRLESKLLPSLQPFLGHKAGRSLFNTQVCPPSWLPSWLRAPRLVQCLPDPHGRCRRRRPRRAHLPPEAARTSRAAARRSGLPATRQ